jgi:hypothetical protein
MINTFREKLRQLAADLKVEKDLRHPYVVDQRGLTRLVLGDERFRAELDARRRWIEGIRSASFAFDVLPDGTGREYRFESYYDAFLFMMHFDTRVFPPAEDR